MVQAVLESVTAGKIASAITSLGCVHVNPVTEVEPAAEDVNKESSVPSVGKLVPVKMGPPVTLSVVNVHVYQVSSDPPAPSRVQRELTV